MQDAVYLDQIRQLVELQKIDDEIFDVRRELEDTPRELSALEDRFEALEQRRNRVLDKLAHLEDQKKRISLEIDDDAARLKKSKNKLMQVGNSREYNAMLREMDSMEKMNRTREVDKVTLLEELERQNEERAGLDAEHAALDSELSEKRATLEDRLREANERLAVLEHKRSLAGRNIPQPIFMRYEFIRQRLEHPVIVAVGEGVCSGCNISVPPQTFIELQRGQQILSCPNCQRLIFWDEHFGPSPAREEQSEASPEPAEEAEQSGD